MPESFDRKQLDEIAFVLAERSKPTLVLISAGSYRKRDELRAELDRLLPAYRSALLDLSGHPITSLFRAVRERTPAEILNSRPGEYLLHIYGVEDSLLVSQDGTLAASSLIAELNLERENLFHEFPCCLVLWTTLHFTGKLRNDAPDLWDWITYNYHFLDDHCAADADEVPQPVSAPSGVTAERQKRIDELEERLQALRLDDEAPERVLRAKLSLHKALGSEYLAAFRYGDAIRCYTAALALLGQTRHARIDEAEIFFHLGTAHLAARHFAKALTSYKESLRIQKQADNHNNIGSTWHQIGMVFAKQRQWSRALESYHKTIEWHEKTGRQHQLGSTWHQIGNVHAEQRQWPQSLESYHNALEWHEKTGQQHELGGTWHQIGNVYAEQRQWPQALESYRKALEWKEKTGQQHQLGATWHQIGRVYEEQKDYPAAVQNYLQAWLLCSNTAMSHEAAIVLRSLRRLFSDLSEEDREELRQTFPQGLQDQLAVTEEDESTVTA